MIFVTRERFTVKLFTVARHIYFGSLIIFAISLSVLGALSQFSITWAKCSFSNPSAAKSTIENCQNLLVD